MKNILILGASGYLGARFANYLSNRGFSITAQCYPSAPNDEEWQASVNQVIIGDVGDERIIDRIVSVDADFIVYLVSLSMSKSQGDPEYVTGVNVLPFWNLMEKIKERKTRVIYFSTFHVYGKQWGDLIMEDLRPNPQNQYGLTHLMAEEVGRFYNKKDYLKCINIRLSNSYGYPVVENRECWELVLNDFCKQAFENGSIKLLSDGTPQRDFIYGEDVACAVETIINNFDEVKFDTFNIASGQTRTLIQIAITVQRIAEKILSNHIDILFNEQELSVENAVKRSKIDYNIDISRLSELGYSECVSLEKGIEGVFNALKNQ